MLVTGARRGAVLDNALTEQGLDALRDYAGTPVSLMPLKSDALLRLLICDLVGENLTRKSMATLRDEIADVTERVEASERSARRLPHREKYLQLVNAFLRQFIELEALIDDVEREPGSETQAGSRSA